MICYKDKTFCPFFEECKDGHKCDKALTNDVIENAVEWWGNTDAPIAMFMEKPECFNHV